MFLYRSWCCPTHHHPTSMHTVATRSATVHSRQNCNVPCSGLVTLKFLRYQSGEWASRCAVYQYSASTTRHHQATNCQIVNHSSDNWKRNDWVHTEFRQFLLLSYFGMLAWIKMCYTVIIGMCRIRLCTCFSIITLNVHKNCSFLNKL